LQKNGTCSTIKTGKFIRKKNNLTDKGKLAERQGRKAMGLKLNMSHDRQASEAGFYNLNPLVGPSSEGF
jgi:hypothetical protein